MRINDFMEDLIVNQLGARPASEGQYGYGYVLNYSRNEVVCNGLPSTQEVLRDGSIVREYCGHGIGREMHEEPQVLYCGKPGTEPIWREGMVFTMDGKLSAQFEHTVAVTRDGARVLSLRPEERPLPRT